MSLKNSSCSQFGSDKEKQEKIDVCIMGMTSQKGQSMVEFVVIVPLFFLICSGVLFFFYAQLRNVIDDFSASALASSSAFFPTAERQAGLWTNATQDSVSLRAHTTSALLNSHTADRKKLQQASAQECASQEPSYSVTSQDFTTFKLSTCADASGYHRGAEALRAEKILQKSTLHTFIISPLYLPHAEWRWEERPDVAARSVDAFETSAQGVNFYRAVASLSYPQDVGHFNQQCYMAPQGALCGVIKVEEKFDRAVYDGAHAQIAACALEAVTSCGASSPEGVSYAVCVAARMASLSASVLQGQRSFECPRLNRMVEERERINALKLRTISAQERVQESLLRR